MNRDFFFNPELQFQSHWKMMTLTPEMSLSPEKTTNDVISRPNWAKSDQYSQFDSTVSSIVSSPVSNSSNDIVTVGKLGNTPLTSSPSELNLPIMDHFVTENFAKIRNSIPMDPNLPLFAADPEFTERAAKFSCFGSRSFNGRTHQLGSNVSPVTRVSSSPMLKIDRSPEENMKLSRLSASAANSNEESSVSEQIPPQELKFKKQNDSTSRKRKGAIGSTTKKGEEAIDDLKKPKKTEHENGGETKEKTKPPEPPKDYIHVRARRGQATDSHSLAERVRREKISERMKLLQNLVPNCNKVTGKALMLDEIINYVQSLQTQVEFLSMKLATVNPSLDFASNDVIAQNTNQLKGNLSPQISNFHQQNHQEIFNESALMTQSIHEFAEPLRDFQGFGEDDLHSIVRMGFDQNLNFDTSFFHTTVDQLPNMKTEL